MPTPRRTNRRRKPYFYGTSSFRGADPMDKWGLIGGLALTAVIIVGAIVAFT